MKKAFLLICLGAAFLAVSLWVVLSGGRSAKAVRAKFRLGGAILSLVSLTALTSCEGRGPFVSCYDPVPPPSNDVYIGSDIRGGQFRNGDVILFTYRCDFEDELQIDITSAEGEVLQSEKIAIVPDSQGQSLEFVLNVGDYVGAAKLHGSYCCYEEQTIDFEVDILIVE